MTEKNKRVWVWGAVAVLVVGVGVWWFSISANQDDTGAPLGYTSTTTPDALVVPNTPLVVEELRTTNTVAGVIASLTNESRFAGLLSSTGVSALIKGKGPYTIFMPTDASFSLLPAGTINDLTAAQLKRLVEYHVIAGKEINVNAVLSGTEQALSKDMLNFSILPQDKSARINNAIVLHAYKASNGIVYVVSQVLVPPMKSGI